MLPTLTKLQKLLKKIKNWKTWVGNTAFASELPDYSVLLVKFIELVVIGTIDRLLGGIGGVPDKFPVTDPKVSIGNSMTSVADPNFQINLYRHRLPSASAAICHRMSQG